MIADKLQLGDTIGIVAPASGERKEVIDNGIAYLKKLGFHTKIGAHLYDKYGFLAGNDKSRAADFMEMFLDPNVKMVMCMRGGYGSMRIIDYIDMEIIKNNPKIFTGFSDITILLNYINKLTGLITFHGPMINSNINDEYTLKSFLSTLTEARTTYLLENPDYLALECSVNGVVEGEIVGGNLAMICSSLGTPYEIETTDKILFIEEIGEAPYRIDRMFTQLIHSGKLNKCKGFILGQFKDCGLSNYDRSFTLPQVIEDRIFSLNKPTISHFMSGHGNPKITIPIGAKVQLNCNTSEIRVLEPVVKLSS